MAGLNHAEHQRASASARQFAPLTPKSSQHNEKNSFDPLVVLVLENASWHSEAVPGRTLSFSESRQVGLKRYWPCQRQADI
jgi:hypothetical protein